MGYKRRPNSRNKEFNLEREEKEGGVGGKKKVRKRNNNRHNTKI